MHTTNKTKVSKKETRGKKGGQTQIQEKKPSLPKDQKQTEDRKGQEGYPGQGLHVTKPRRTVRVFRYLY